MLFGYQGKKNLGKVHKGHEERERDHADEEYLLIAPKLPDQGEDVVKVQTRLVAAIHLLTLLEATDIQLEFLIATALAAMQGISTARSTS